MMFLRNCFLVMAMTMVHGFQVAPPDTALPATRRSFFVNSLIVVGILGGNQEKAEASARGYQISRKLRAQEAHKRENAPQQALPSGVAFQEFLAGRSGFEVRPDSLVTAEIKLAGTKKAMTAQFRMGTGKLLAGLEEGLVGMNLHGSRRIVVPYDLVRKGQEQGQLPLPQMDAAQLEQWFGETATASGALAYEVQVIGLQ